jgi:hypothetical protein
MNKVPINLKEWTDLAAKSHYVREGDCISFRLPDERGLILAYVECINCHGEETSIMIGAYATKKTQYMEAGTGWLHF